METARSTGAWYFLLSCHQRCVVRWSNLPAQRIQCLSNDLRQVPRFKVQLWDKDILTPNDAIGEANLNLKGLFKKAYKSQAKHSIGRQWVRLTHPNFEGDQGQVEMQIDLLTAAEARQFPAGLGRSDPNDHPYLPDPVRSRCMPSCVWSSSNTFPLPLRYGQRPHSHHGE